MIIQAPRETLLRCDSVRCGDVERFPKITEIEARLWMAKWGWQTTTSQKHFWRRAAR